MQINILGFGIMAKQIAALFLLMGHDITIWNHREIDIEKLYKQIKLQSKYLHLDSANIGEIKIVKSLDELQDNLTIESIVENLDLKIKLYNALKTKITNDYFTNSSSIAPLEIGKKVNGLHFFNPVFSVKMVEFYKNSVKNEKSFQLLKDLIEIGFEVVEVLNTRGYIANYIIFNEISNMFKLIELYNYPLDEIEKVYDRLFDKNLFKIIDIIGVDITYNIIKNLKEQDSSIYLPKILKESIENNILGKKNGTSIRKYFEELRI